MAACAAAAALMGGAAAGASVGPDAAGPAHSVAPGLPAVVCGASFSALPAGWHQSGAPTALVIGGRVSSNTFSWAARPPSVFDLVRPLPRDGVYVWVILRRPRGGPTGLPLRTPLRLRDATVIAQEGAPGLPEYRFEGRYRRQYEVTLGVDFGRTSPPLRVRRRVDRVLGALVLPRWVPFTRRSLC